MKLFVSINSALYIIVVLLITCIIAPLDYMWYLLFVENKNQPRYIISTKRKNYPVVGTPYSTLLIAAGHVLNVGYNKEIKVGVHPYKIWMKHQMLKLL